VFFRGSRYEHVPEAELTRADTTIVRYKRLRFVPVVEAALGAAVREGDRPDLVAYRAVGDPEQFWRLCDANRVLRPAELTAVPGRRLRVPAPGGA
jgi:hypothetical protein